MARWGAKAPWYPSPRQGMKPVPADLSLCNSCQRVAGRYGGRYGEECDCK